MTTKQNQRLIALKSVGGTKALRVLPRTRRAQVIASLMIEEPAKTRSEETAAYFAFTSAVKSGDAVRAKKIAVKHCLDKKGCAGLVSAKVSELRSESKDGKSKTADEFEILFQLNFSTIADFDGAMFDRLELAQDKLSKADYPFTHVIYNRILEEGKRLDMRGHEKDAAAGLTICWLRRGSLEDAFNIMEEYLMRGDKLVPEAKELITGELGAYLMKTSKGALNKLVQIAKEKGKAFVELMQDAARNEISGRDPANLEKCETLYIIAQLLEMKEDERNLGVFLVNVHTSLADTQPDKFLEHYLKAADITAKLGMDNAMDEAVMKYVLTCNNLGETDPAYFEKGMFAAQGFGFDNEAARFAEKAFYGYLAAERLVEANSIANESGRRDLLGHVTHIMSRSEL